MSSYTNQEVRRTQVIDILHPEHEITIDAIAVRLGVSHNTIRNMMRKLVAEGIAINITASKEGLYIRVTE